MSDEQAKPWAQNLKDLMLTTVALIDESKRRLWAARDEVAELERSLVGATQRLVAAERDYTKQQALLEQNWSFFRSEYERLFEPVPAEPPT